MKLASQPRAGLYRKWIVYKDAPGIRLHALDATDRGERKKHASANVVSLLINNDSSLPLVNKKYFAELMPVIKSFEIMIGVYFIVPNNEFGSK